jgi:hypothetical protein
MDETDISLPLTTAQVAAVVRQAAAGGDGLSGLLVAMSDPQLAMAVPPLLEEPGCSRTVLRALLVFTAFPADGGQRRLIDVANRCEMNPSTAHRFVRTWVALGLLEQASNSSGYRRASVQ